MTFSKVAAKPRDGALILAAHGGIADGDNDLVAPRGAGGSGERCPALVGDLLGCPGHHG